MATQALIQIYDAAIKEYREFTTNDLVSIVGGIGGADSPAYIQSKLSSTGPFSLAPKTVPTEGAESVAASTPITKYVRVTSAFENEEVVYVGGADVTVANGTPLGVGDDYTNRDVANAAQIYCISESAGQKLRVEVL